MSGEYFFFVAAVVFALFTFYKKKKKGWQILWSRDAKLHESGSDGFYIDIPKYPGHVNYVQWFRSIFPWAKSPPKLKVGGRIEARFKLTGDGVEPDEFKDGRPATVSLIIQRKGDNGSAVGKYQSYRWYSTQQAELKAGEFSLTANLRVDEWGDIYNGHDSDAFASALKNFESVGFVLGSGGGRGHGVVTTQDARLTLLSFKVV